MKTIAITLLFLAFALCGCTAIPKGAMKLPAISAKKFTAEVNGRFSHTTIVADNIVNGAETISADRAEFKHDNPWLNARIVVEGYTRTKEPADGRSTPTNTPAK